MTESEYDRLLHIQTAGTKEFPLQLAHYNRYEATPYEALDALFNEYEIEKSDEAVDFGCGKGRLLFYLHHRFGISGTGIEFNGQLYQEALENQAAYMRKTKQRTGAIHFSRMAAEQYDIRPGENRFYFFNPFSVQIFMKVVHRILLSVEKNPRRADLILYYPTADYIHFLDENTPFSLEKEVPVPGLYERNENERFLIYKYPCQD